MGKTVIENIGTGNLQRNLRPGAAVFRKGRFIMEKIV